MPDQNFYGSRVSGSISQLEAEIAELEKQERGEAPTSDTPTDTPTEVPTETPVDAPVVEQEDGSWKKRYSDLRRHMNEKESEHKRQLNDLQRQINDLGNSQMQLPTSEAELEAWIREYPDVAKIVESIAIRKVNEARADLDKRFEEVEEDRRTVEREKAMNKLLDKHPDFLDIKSSEDFHDWIKDPENPEWVRDSLYRNETDWRAASRAVDLYKADKGLTAKPKKTHDPRAAAAPVKAGIREEVQTQAKQYRESEVNKLRPAQFEALWPEIQKAMREGNFVYDLSGGAR